MTSDQELAKAHLPHNSSDGKPRKKDPSHQYHSRKTMCTNSSARGVNEDDEEDEVNNGMISSSNFIQPSISLIYSPSAINSPNSYLNHDHHCIDQRRHSSKELFTIHQQHPPHSSSSNAAAASVPTVVDSTASDESQSKSNLCTASTLVVTYLIEVAIQIYICVQCCRYLQREVLPSDFLFYDNFTTVYSSWSWFLILASVLSSFIITIISITWIFRGMDFTGRGCGKLLCLAMHSFLLGILWRYLKLAFAYDKADLEEFFKLKTIQTYVQSLPLVTIHLAWVLTLMSAQQEQQSLFILQSDFESEADSYHALSSWLVVAEMLCAVMSLALLSTTSSFTLPSTCGNNNNNLRGIVVSKPSSPGGEKSKKILKVEKSGFCSSDNNPNYRFNDSTRADNQRRNRSEIEEERVGGGDDDNEKRKSFCSFSWLKTAVKWLVMSHYSSNHRNRCELGRALLLLSRLISLGMLVYKMNYYWTTFIIALHLFVSYVWLGCWLTRSNLIARVDTKGEGVFKTGHSTKLENSLTNSEHQGEGDAFETRSSTSNDSGVVRSEVVMDNGIPAMIPEDDDHHQTPDQQQQDHNNEEYEGLSGCARVYPFKSFNALPNCLTQVIVQRPICDSSVGAGEKVLGKGSHFISRLLPLTYLLFWDLSSSWSGYLCRNFKLNLCSAALPLLFVVAENMSISVYFLIWKKDTEENLLYLSLLSLICLLLGWVLRAVYHFQQRKHSKSQKLHHHHHHNEVEQVELDIDPDDVDDVDSGYGRKVNDGGVDSGVSTFKSTMKKKKETGECLSLCCSSLSHPLNIKRKGHRDQLRQDSTEDNNFAKNHTSGPPSSDPITMKNLNEYEEQQEIGRLVHSHSHSHYHQQHFNPSHNNSNDHTVSRKVTKNSIIFPDLGLPSDHSGVRREDNLITMKQEMNLRRECETEEDNGTMLMACAQPNCNTTPCTTLPVTNNYSNIKEALTRRISNKSSGSLKKQTKRTTHHHHHPHHHDKAMNQAERESMEGEGEKGCDGKGVISSFKSSSSSSASAHLSTSKPEQHLPPPPSNSNKCMPISIKSPISWLPESCCNDSSLGSGSSNSRNTNTLVTTTTTTSSKLLYCPEKYIDFQNNNVEQMEKRTGTSRHEQRHQHHHHHHPIQNHSDFSVVFFEGRAGGSCGRSYKQKQSRTTVQSSGLFGRTARSANATPVAHPASKERDRRNPVYFEYTAEPCCDRELEHDPIQVKSMKHEGRSIRLRNQITGKTYLSDGASLTSLDGLCENPRASTPVEIKKASRVLVNYPPPHHQFSDSKTVSRCSCKVESSPTQRANNKCVIQPKLYQVQTNHGDEDDEELSEGEEVDDIVIPEKTGASCINNNNIYEKLIEDSYGILICEGENRQNCRASQNCIVTGNDYSRHHHHPSPSRLTNVLNGDGGTSGGGGGQVQFLVRCAKCLRNHDPLITNCQNAPVPINVGLIHNSQISGRRSVPNPVSDYPHHDSEGSQTTDYPSDTEFTATMHNPIEDDVQSLSTHFSSATYTWHHHHPPPPPQSNYPHHYQPTQLSQFIWAASQMMPTTTASAEGVGGEEHQQQQQCPKEFTGLEYVRTWLLANDPRTFVAQNMSHKNNGSRATPTINNTHQQHQHLHCNNEQQRTQQENDISEERQTSKTDKRVLVLSSNNGSNNSGNNNNTQFKNKSPWQENKILKKKHQKFRQLEKRQRPVGRGASPPLKELRSVNTNTTTTNNNNDNNINRPGIVLTEENDAESNAAAVNAATATTTSNTNKTATASSSSPSFAAAVVGEFQPPPSSKQHPLLLFYDMMPQQEEQKPLTSTKATSHKKCRDQLDLFHKELETVV